MRLDGLEHPKVLDLADRLGVSLPTAIGHLELLWAFVGKMAPAGNLGKYTDGAIAGAARWDGNAAHFVDSMLLARLLDECGTHRLIVHDWHDHCSSWVRAKVKRLRVELITAPTPPKEPTRVATIVATAAASLEATPRARASPSQAKPSQAHIHARTIEPTIEPTAAGSPPPAPTGHPQEWENAGTIPPMPDGERMDAFAAIRQAFPKRAGRGHGWILAERAWGKLIDEGITDPVTLQAGVDRYAAYIAGGGVSSNAYVMDAAQFFGAVDRPWEQAWELPQKIGGGSGRKTFEDYQRDSGAKFDEPGPGGL